MTGCWPHSGPTRLCTATGTEAARTSPSLANRHADSPPVFHNHPAVGDGVIMSTDSSRVFPFFLANTTRSLCPPARCAVGRSGRFVPSPDGGLSGPAAAARLPHARSGRPAGRCPADTPTQSAYQNIRSLLSLPVVRSSYQDKSRDGCQQAHTRPNGRQRNRTRDLIGNCQQNRAHNTRKSHVPHSAEQASCAPESCRRTAAPIQVPSPRLGCNPRHTCPSQTRCAPV